MLLPLLCCNDLVPFPNRAARISWSEWLVLRHFMTQSQTTATKNDLANKNAVNQADLKHTNLHMQAKNRCKKRLVRYSDAPAVAKRALSRAFVQIYTTWNQDMGFCWGMPCAYADKAPSISFSHFPRPMAAPRHKHAQPSFHSHFTLIADVSSRLSWRYCQYAPDIQ